MRYPYASLFALTHAYAISVHKAQGAEFPAVVIPLVTSHAPMLGPDAALHGADPRPAARRDRGPEEGAVPGGPRLAAGARHTALGGLLAGTLRFAWPHRTEPGEGAGTEEDASGWEGLLTGTLDEPAPPAS